MISLGSARKTSPAGYENLKKVKKLTAPSYLRIITKRGANKQRLHSIFSERGPFANKELKLLKILRGMNRSATQVNQAM